MTRENHGPAHADRNLPWDRPVTRRDLLRYGGLLGFGAVGATMLASCTPLAGAPGPGADDQLSAPPAEAKYLAVVIVDGCRADYLSGKYGHTPTLDAMAASGTRYVNAWTGIMESITPACHASIGTGRFAKNNGGILGFYWENPDTHVYGEHVNLTDTLTASAPGGQQAIDPTTLENILRQAKTPTMAGLLKQVDPTAKVYAGAGVKFYAADAVGGPDADWITYFWNDGASKYRPLSIAGHELPAGLLDDPTLTTYDYTGHHTTMDYAHPGQQDSLVVDLAVKVVKRERPRMVILNLGEMDFPFGHITGGPETPRYPKAIMESADRAMKRLQDAYRELGIFDQTVFAFLGDHGMVPLRQQVDISPVARAAAQAGTSLATGPNPAGGTLQGGDFHTGGFVWINDPDKAFKMSVALDRIKMPAVSGVYFRGEVAGRPQFLPSPATASSINPNSGAAYQYLLETLNGPNAPHVVLIYPEMTGTVGSGGSVTRPWHGDHGGASWQSHAIPLILSGPGVRKGHQSRFPARLVDLAPTFLRLLGVPFPLLDGVVLADAIRRPEKGEIESQRTVAAMLIPVAAALKRQSALDVNYLKLNVPVNPPPPATSQEIFGKY